MALKLESSQHCPFQRPNTLSHLTLLAIAAPYSADRATGNSGRDNLVVSHVRNVIRHTQSLKLPEFIELGFPFLSRRRQSLFSTHSILAEPFIKVPPHAKDLSALVVHPLDMIAYVFVRFANKCRKSFASARLISAP